MKTISQEKTSLQKDSAHWEAAVHHFHFRDFLHAGINLSSESEVAHDGSQKKDGDNINLKSSVQIPVHPSARKSGATAETHFTESIFEYCENFQIRNSLDKFCRKLMNILQKISHAESITIFLFHDDKTFQAILEKRNKVFLSGVHTKLTHSVDTLIKHFRQGQYLLSQSEPLIYLPLILQSKPNKYSIGQETEDRLLGFLQLTTPPSIQRNSVQYLWLHIQKYVQLLGEILDFENSTTDPISGCHNSMLFHRDCHQAYESSQKPNQALQLTLFRFQELWEIKQSMGERETHTHLAENFESEQQIITKIVETLESNENNFFLRPKNYRLTKDVFACIERQLSRKDFEKKIRGISENLESHTSFSISSAICSRKFSSPKDWLEQVILGLH